jgi:hypothetical protein
VYKIVELIIEMKMKMKIKAKVNMNMDMNNKIKINNYKIVITIITISHYNNNLNYIINNPNIPNLLYTNNPKPKHNLFHKHKHNPNK